MIKECENCGTEIDVNEDDECLCDDCGEDVFAEDDDEYDDPNANGA